MKTTEAFKKNLNNSLKKKIQENTGKQVKALKEETIKPLKEIQENIIKQVKVSNKTILELKMEIEAIKKTQKEATLKMDNLGKKSRAIDEIITNRIQEIEENLKFRRYHRKYRHIPQRKYKV